MNKTPEIIYLIPGEDLDGAPAMVWCDDPAPSYADDPDEAVKYVRADIHESALKRQGNAAKMGMDAAKKDTSWREENARRLLAESNPAALESEWAMNANLTGEVERLQSRVAELECMVRAFRDCVDLQMVPSWGSTCHDQIHALVGESMEDDQ